MRMQRLGTSNLELSRIGLGTWAIGGPWAYGWGPQSDRDSIAAICRALDLGINWIDTAPAYGLGHAEEVVGRAIKGRRNEVIIATKCGLVWDDPALRQVRSELKAQSVRREAEASLKRLGVEVIDLYQIHWPDPDGDIEEAWGVIGKLIQTGKIRYGGVSNFSLAQLSRINAIRPAVSLQPPYSLLDRGVEQQLLAFCRNQGIGVIGYGPLAYGLLTGKFTQAGLAALPADDWRRQGGRFQEPELTANLALVERLSAIARRHERPLAQLAIAWVLRRPEVTAAIVGARRPEQIEQTAPGADWDLPAADLREIEELLADRDSDLAGTTTLPSS